MRATPKAPVTAWPRLWRPGGPTTAFVARDANGKSRRDETKNKPAGLASSKTESEPQFRIVRLASCGKLTVASPTTSARGKRPSEMDRVVTSYFDEFLSIANAD